MRYGHKKNLFRTICRYLPEDSRTGFVQLDRGMHKVIAKHYENRFGRSSCVHAPDGNGAAMPREKLACGQILYIITAIGISCPEQPKWMN